MTPGRIVILCILGCVVASIAPACHAGLIRCDSHTITAQDLGRAMATARRVAGHSKLLTTGRHVCMNPGRGRVWIDAQDEPQPDSSVIHPAVLCTRKARPWGCELLKSRTANITVERDGTRHTLEFDLPVDLDLEAARQLVTRTYGIGPSISNASCGEKPDPKDPEHGAMRAFGTKDFDPAAESYERRILNLDDGSLVVLIDASGITFKRNGAGVWEIISCGGWVTVT